MMSYDTRDDLENDETAGRVFNFCTVTWTVLSITFVVDVKIKIFNNM